MATAKLFRNGRSQAVRLPKEFRFEGDEQSLAPSFGSVMPGLRKRLLSDGSRLCAARPRRLEEIWGNACAAERVL